VSLLPLQQQAIIYDTSLDDFYSTWANSTTPPSAEWDGMLVSFAGMPSGLPMAAAEQLWDPSVMYSLTNSSQESIAGWFNASISSLPEGDFTEGNYVNATLDSWTFLADRFGITETQVEMIGTWLREQFYTTYADPSLVATYSALDEGVKEVRDIGWLQWGACNVISQEVKISAAKAFYFYPGGKPEYGCSDPLAPPLTVAQSKELLGGSDGVVSLPGLVDFIVVYVDAAESCPEGALTANLTACVDCTSCESENCTAEYVGAANPCSCGSTGGSCTPNPSFVSCTVTAGNGTCEYNAANGTCASGMAGTICNVTDTADACEGSGGATCVYAATNATSWTCTMQPQSCLFNSTSQSCYSNDGCAECDLDPALSPSSSMCTYSSANDTCVSNNTDYSCSLSSASVSCSGSVSCANCAFGTSAGDGTTSLDASDCSSCSCPAANATVSHPTCMDCASCGNYTSCNDTAVWQEFEETWGLTKTEAEYFFAYIGIMVLDYGEEELDRVLRANGGLFKTMSVNDWLYHPIDPLMRIVEPDFPTDGRLVVNVTSQAEAEATIPPSKEYTGKSDLDLLNWYITWRNKTHITYAVDVPVSGQDEWGQFQPFQKERGIERLYMFDPNYVRELEIVKMMEVEYRGVELWRYSFSNSTWAPNADYFMTIPGFTNQTIIEGSPIFLSIAHWQGVPTEYTDKVKGVVEGRDWRKDYSVIDIEPHTGLVFHTNASLMVNLYLEPVMEEWLSVYNPNVPVDTFYPVMWALEQALFSTEDALEYTLLVGFILWAQKFLVGLYLTLGLLMFVCAYLLWKWVRDVRERHWERVEYDVSSSHGHGGSGAEEDADTEQLLADLDLG